MNYSEETLKRAKMAVEVGQAVLEGKEVQFEAMIGSHFKSGEPIWVITLDPSLNFYKENFRVKPEPKLIPFTFDDAKDLIGKGIIHKTEKLALLINEVCGDSVGFFNDNISFESLLEWYQFLDGSPCGKIVNQ